MGTNEDALIEQIRKSGAETLRCGDDVFHKLSYRDRPDGLVAIAVQMQRQLRDLVTKKDPFLVIAEAIEKPGNLGTILRSADAAGVDGVIVCDRCTDIYNPNVVRASVGTLFTIPVVEATSVETLRWLQERKIKVIAATPSAEKEFTNTDLTGGVAIAVGTEQIGLSEAWMKSADIQVRIAMNGVADSLNVATATTLILYEVVRQERAMRIIYCDNHLLVVSKPAGLSTQPHDGEDSLSDRAKAWIKKEFQKPGSVFLEPIHRLDKPVSGLVLFARHEQSPLPPSRNDAAASN